ncbi:MAG: hypothetical protein PUI31_02670 [Clostridia bacterium]|nr:hypothetical protein [Clostridiales bacterium]MDD7165562.1 hypothetical protein [Clostridia bacterium]MDY2900871.1 hypothetical protein [Christensenellaceae bacterium]
MFEFNKVMKDYESLNAIERGLMLTEKSVSILAKLSALDIDGLDPVETLASFIIGSVVADGKLHEKEYLLIYPALVKVFGTDFDYESIKKEFEADKDGRNDIAKYTTDLLRILEMADETLYEDVIILCLCVVTIDGKVSLREKNYVKRLIA